MRCTYMPSLVLATALAAWTSLLAADEEIRQPIETMSADAIGVGESIGATQTTTPVESKSSPTPAKRKVIAAPAPIEAAAKAQLPAASAPDSPAPQADDEITDALQPIPDAMESGPVSIETASFKGVSPGASTKEDVEKAWGKPKKSIGEAESLVQSYSIEPFRRVEVSYTGDKVAQIVIRFDRAFPADAIAKQLDLATVRPVLVSNELGEVLGLSYPERGVLFAFEASKEPGKPSMKVAQLILEKISAEPFVLRAETMLESRCDLSRRDLEQALSLEPDNARAHWLLARVLVTMEQYAEAATSAGEAVRLESDNAQYRVTLAQILPHLGRLPEAIAEAEKAAETSQRRPHVKARAVCLAGDLLASGPKPDYQKAMSLHNQALQMADALASDPHPAIRMAAKEVLVDAHLGAAHDIAWGQWKEKDKAVARWLDRALVAADDLVDSEGGSPECILRVHCRAMAEYVGLRGAIDPEPTLKALLSSGGEAIAATSDPIRKAKLESDLGMALSYAVQVYQMRADHDNALTYGKQAAEYLAKADEVKKSPASAVVLGRLYFRLGAVNAVGLHDHRSAVEWFDQAIPLLERAAPTELAADLGRHGESFVSMGVSYWEADQKPKAVALTEKGIQSMELAVKRGVIDRLSLSVPYNNLAAMHRKLGSTEQADRYQQLAGRAREKLK